jgi:hypothetical protein
VVLFRSMRWCLLRRIVASLPLPQNGFFDGLTLPDLASVSLKLYLRT